MILTHSRFLCSVAGVMIALLGLVPTAGADDSEVFTSSSFVAGSGVRPNVLFVIDTSGSMSTAVIVYDPAVTYSGPCNVNTIYWQTADSAKPPDCASTNQTLTLASNRCREGYVGMRDNGWWRGRVQQLNGASSAWQDMVSGQPGRPIDCEPDHSNHGDVIGSSAAGSEPKYARNGGEAGRANRWGSGSSSNRLNWSNKQRISLYSGNYANYFLGGGSGSFKSRLDIVRDVAKNLITNLQGVNLGLMRYSNNEGGTYETTAEGGMVTFPVSELTAANRTAMKAELDSYVAAGNTPLSETFYEAHQYLAGRAVTYGNGSKLNASTDYHSVPASRVGGAAGANYESPMDFSCQKTFIVYLTDGLPTADDSASDDIDALPDTTCEAAGPDLTVNGRCMIALSKYMAEHDLRTDVGGMQNVSTYVVGFGDDIATSAAFLEDVASAGGGKSYTQSDQAGLQAALEQIFLDVAQGANTTFVSPTVAVNAFNRSRNLDSLFVSVFAPTNRLHWPGNLKKYRLINGQIHGTDGVTPAVDPDSGFFSDASKDMFNADTSPDGPDVTKGGAASRITSFSTRKMYTYLGGVANLTLASNAMTSGNALITNVMLGLPAAATATDRTELIEFVRGRDLRNDDDDTNGDTTDDRKQMGDPMRVRPAVAIYGGTEAAPIGTIFVTTNDGLLHAINMATGAELWSFLPPEFLGRQKALLDDAPVSARQYALDGDVRIFKYDVNDNGIVETGDKVYAVFGFGRGGSTYYALDVTAQNTPLVLWRKNSSTLTKLGETWSPPVITRVNVNSVLQTDAQKFVVIFGGGYDPSQENYAYTSDGVGNAIYMLELTTGNQLWMGSITGTTGANWTNDRMNNSIPSQITVLDTDGDTFADRMYTGDMGGRIWRFDIWHGQAPASLITGGMLAKLGAGELSTPTLADTRRFYYAPDVTLVTPRGSSPYLNIAMGSGYRGHPLEVDVHDRFYSIRDYAPFARRSNSSYASGVWTPISDASVIDVTDNVATPVADGSSGWRLELRNDGWRGEKVLAESVTANGVIFFPTFTPTGVDPSNPCLAITLNRTYAVYLDSAKPFGLRDSPTPGGDPPVGSPEDRFVDLKQGGIAPGLAVVKSPSGETLCLEGVESLGRCVDLGDVVRTYWERRQ